jgi:desulfoferrodoxin (superoxide reductase-like protein)
MSRLICTNCRYILDRRVLADEESASEVTDTEGVLVCPNCGEVDSFFELPGETQTALDADDPESVEIQHTPYWYRDGEKIVVRIGTDDDPHPNDDSHHIESIGLYDTDGEAIEVLERYRFDPELDVVFDGIDPEERVEVRLVCNVHGEWKGVRGAG